MDMVGQMQQNYSKSNCIFKKKNMYDFYKNFFFSVKIFFIFQIKLFIWNKYLYPLSKNLILLKKI